jgi:phosphopantetheine--protein transferase-like protein
MFDCAAEALQHWRIIEPLVGAQLHLYWLKVDQAQCWEWAAEWFSTDEQERFARLRHSQARRSQMAARALLRCLLAQYTQLEPQQCRFQYGSHGKPMLASSMTQRSASCDHLHFNVAHTHHWVMLGIGQQVAVGVDIEQWPVQQDVMALARRFFHPDEYAHLQQQASHERARSFARMWVAKEALGKADGGGLTRFLGESMLASVRHQSSGSEVQQHFKGCCWAWTEAPSEHSAAWAWMSPGIPLVKKKIFDIN